MVMFTLLVLFLIPPDPTASRQLGPGQTFTDSWYDNSPRLTLQALPVTISSLALPSNGNDQACTIATSDTGDRAAYQYLSSIRKAEIPFNAVGFRWDGNLSLSSAVSIETRTSEDGHSWTPWMETEELDAERGMTTKSTDLVFSSGQYLQYRLTVLQPADISQPVVDQVRVIFIDSTQGPSAQEAAASNGSGLRLSALAQPAPISRQSWGANQSLLYDQGELRWTPQYAPVQKIIIHHTATSNNPADPAAAVRAIYYYHTIEQGWGDIGYHYLVDQEGRVYQGRNGGDNIVAAHALNHNKGSLGVALLGTFTNSSPSPKAQQALESFLLAKSVQHGIDPNGRSVFVGEDVPNILGHRDVVSTTCPGVPVYESLSFLRNKTASALPPLGEAWLSDTTPMVLGTSEDTAVSLSVRNSGTATWDTALPSPVRIAYHWYTPDGRLYAAEGNLELQTDLLNPVKPRETARIQAKLRTPAAEGQYILKWDMVQRGVTWFTEQGNLPLERTVLVAPWAKLPNDQIINLPNELVSLLPVDRLRTLPLSRLTVLSNTHLVERIPDIIQLFPNDRVLSFSNEMLISYLPDTRLKTFSLDRIRTFPLYLQQRLGLAPATATPSATTPPMPTPTRAPFISDTPTPTPTPTPVAKPTQTSAPQPAANSSPPQTPTPTPTPVPENRDPGGGAAP